MDDKPRQAEIKRIQDMISRLEAEQEFMSLFDQPSDVSSLPYEEIDLDSVLFDDMEASPAPMPDFKTSTPITKTIERLGTEPPAQETASAPTPTPVPAVAVPQTEPVIAPPPVPEFQYTTQAAQEPSVPAVETAPPIEATIPQQTAEPITASPIISEPAQTPAPAPAPAVAPAPVDPVVAPPPVPEFQFAAQAAQEASATAPAASTQTEVPSPAPTPIVEDAPLPVVEAAPQPAAPVPVAATAAPVSMPVAKKGRRTRKHKLRERAILITVIAACVILVAAVFLLSHKSIIKLPHSSSSDKKEAAVDSASDQVDKISCADGSIKVNNVSVTVPEESATYSISYTWGRDDTDEPTIPHAGTASYYNKDGKLLYDITLYRDSFTKTKDIPEGKDATNWFSDWATDESENSLHKPMDSGSIHGFLLSSTEDAAGDSAGSTYSSTSYYFAVQDRKGLSIYVLESILYDTDSEDTYNKLMDDCIKSIKVS